MACEQTQIEKRPRMAVRMQTERDKQRIIWLRNELSMRLSDQILTADERRISEIRAELRELGAIY